MPPQGWKKGGDFEVEGMKFTEEDVNLIYVCALLIRGTDRPDMNRSIPNPHGTVYTYTAEQIKGLVGEILMEKGKTAADLADSATWPSWETKQRVSDWRDPRKPSTRMLNDRVGSNIDKYLRRSSTLYERYLLANPGQATRSGDLNPGLQPPALGSFQHWQSSADRPPGSSIQGMTAEMEAASLTQTARSSKRATQPKTPVAPPAQSKKALPDGRRESKKAKQPTSAAKTGPMTESMESMTLNAPALAPALQSSPGQRRRRVAESSRQQSTRRSSTPPDLTPALPSSWDPNHYLQPPAQSQYNPYAEQQLFHPSGSHQSSYGVPQSSYQRPAQPQYDPYAEQQLSHPSGSHQSSYGVPQSSHLQWPAGTYGVLQSSVRGITADMNAASLTPTAGSSMQASYDEPPAQSKGFAIGGKILPESEESVVYVCAIDKGVGHEYTYSYLDIWGVITEMFKEDQQAEHANSKAWARYKVDDRVKRWRDPDRHHTQILRERVRYVKTQKLERASELYRRHILVHPEMARGRRTSSKRHYPKRRSEQESSVPGVPANLTSILQTPERSRNEEEERARKRPAEGGNGQGAGGSRDPKAPRRKDGSSGRGR